MSSILELNEAPQSPLMLEAVCLPQPTFRGTAICKSEPTFYFQTPLPRRILYVLVVFLLFLCPFIGFAVSLRRVRHDHFIKVKRFGRRRQNPSVWNFFGVRMFFAFPLIDKVSMEPMTSINCHGVRCPMYVDTGLQRVLVRSLDDVQAAIFIWRAIVQTNGDPQDKIFTTKLVTTTANILRVQAARKIHQNLLQKYVQAEIAAATKGDLQMALRADGDVIENLEVYLGEFETDDFGNEFFLPFRHS